MLVRDYESNSTCCAVDSWQQCLLPITCTGSYCLHMGLCDSTRLDLGEHLSVLAGILI